MLPSSPLFLEVFEWFLRIPCSAPNFVFNFNAALLPLIYIAPMAVQRGYFILMETLGRIDILLSIDRPTRFGKQSFHIVRFLFKKQQYNPPRARTYIELYVLLIEFAQCWGCTSRALEMAIHPDRANYSVWGVVPLLYQKAVPQILAWIVIVGNIYRIFL